MAEVLPVPARVCRCPAGFANFTTRPGYFYLLFLNVTEALRAASFSTDFEPRWQLATKSSGSRPSLRQLARSPLKKYNLSHGTCSRPGPAPLRRCPAKLVAFTARGQPEIRQMSRASAGTRAISGQLGRTWADFRPSSSRIFSPVPARVAAEHARTPPGAR